MQACTIAGVFKCLEFSSLASRNQSYILTHFFPLQIIMLVLAWKLEAESMGFFTKEEWLKGMTSLQ